MRTRIQKWGNSLAVRIPRGVAAELGLRSEAVVELRAREGVLEVFRIEEEAATLDDLLAQVTDSNLHGECATGGAQGREAW